jgi:hypothetical protein
VGDAYSINEENSMDVTTEARNASLQDLAEMEGKALDALDHAYAMAVR